ncbi:MAG TPA: protein kinase [Methanospirillum sp.]|uniref:protein kinase domain-containing protein n=1 Tax=Methanospirillum sp. TaxID=45200 RepID=UPI002CAF58CC|nr:protein kinase [Methanospirillum sp.]HWQ64360.1 protein kinase [Methanospirillum sp.]
MSIRYTWLRILACVVLFVVLGVLMPSLADAVPASIDVSYYKGEHSNDTIPDMIEAGQTYPVTVTFRNTGMVSWDWGVEKFGLLYQGLQSSILVDPIFSRLGKDTETKPGDEITFPLILTPPEKPGDYTISFSMATLKGDSYNTFPETFSKTVKVISEDGISSGSVGSIIVSSIPTGSQVLIGGDVRGKTPLTIPDLRPAMYDLSVASPDYKTKAVQVTVEAGSVSRLRVDLTSSNKTDISIEKDERYTLLGFLKGNLPLLILTIAILFFGLQMLMMDTKRFPENHPVRLFVRPITIVPVSFDGKVSSRKFSKKGSTSGSENVGAGADEHGSKKGDVSATRTTGQTLSRSKELKDKKPGYGDEQKNKKDLKGENADELKVPDVDQQYQDISNPFGFPDGLKDRYEPLGVAGDDSYARVFKVRKKDNGSIRALKVSHMKNAGSEILQKEASVWGNIRHPNVVRLYKAEFDDELSFLDLEFLDGIKYRGGSLTSLSALPKPIREKYAVSLIRDVANGLKFTHSLGIRHYHLQTGDILLTPKMQAKISGYARGKNELGFSVPESDTREAPAAYLAPEQKDEVFYGNPGRKTDIYQLGVIFYELLTGFLPYTRLAADKASVEWHESAENRLILPSELKNGLLRYDVILSRMLATDKKKRYALVDEFLADLDTATAT